MAKTRAQLRDSLRIEINDPDGVTLSDDKVDYAIQTAYEEVFALVANTIKSHFVLTDYMDIVASQREYALPSDFSRMKSLEFNRSGCTTPIKQKVRGVETNSTTGGSITTNSVGAIFEYDFEADNFVLEPTPLWSLTDGLKLTYYPEPITFTADSGVGGTVNAGFKDSWCRLVILEAAQTCHSIIESLGGKVDNTALQNRLDKARSSLKDTLSLRTLSPVRNRRKGYFK